MTFSLQAQLEEVEREIVLRERVYPNQVRMQKMRQGIADYHMGRMKAVADTLRRLIEKEMT